MTSWLNQRACRPGVWLHELSYILCHETMAVKFARPVVFVLVMLVKCYDLLLYLNAKAV